MSHLASIFVLTSLEAVFCCCVVEAIFILSLTKKDLCLHGLSSLDDEKDTISKNMAVPGIVEYYFFGQIVLDLVWAVNSQDCDAAKSSADL